MQKKTQKSNSTGHPQHPPSGKLTGTRAAASPNSRAAQFQHVPHVLREPRALTGRENKRRALTVLKLPETKPRLKATKIPLCREATSENPRLLSPVFCWDFARQRVEISDTATLAREYKGRGGNTPTPSFHPSSPPPPAYKKTLTKYAKPRNNT